jgi:N-acetylglucosaminyldiphosphoundecaprenol N-acetyl-beta-D-mannosaminyltransferase
VNEYPLIPAQNDPPGLPQIISNDGRRRKGVASNCVAADVIVPRMAGSGGSALSTKKIFGFRVSPFTARDIVQTITGVRRTEAQGVGIVVTANLDHIVKLQKNADFAAAYAAAEIVTCDGFPVFYFARLRGVDSRGRVTGTEITERLLQAHDAVRGHKLFFVADSDETVRGLRQWSESIGLPAGDVGFAVPAFGFERDVKRCTELAQEITQHRTSILLMGVGAPKSEIFLNSYRHLLPPCWSLCVGISLRIEAGLMRRAPKIMQNIHLEWLWRVGCEPRRLMGRYLTGSVLFTYAAIRELLSTDAT